MRQAILDAARSVLVREGLAHWTIEKSAMTAGCAKGLVLYHFRTKHALLVELAAVLRDARLEGRREAMARRGTAALDRLWSVLEREVRGGEFSAWLSLTADHDPTVSAATRPAEQALGELGTAAAAALGLAHPLDGMVIEAMLNGFQMELLAGRDPARLLEGYHRGWLSLIEA
ncbi:MAG: TetR family transcriptional regulator [Gemmatimonadales bacterium]